MLLLVGVEVVEEGVVEAGCADCIVLGILRCGTPPPPLPADSGSYGTVTGITF